MTQTPLRKITVEEIILSEGFLMILHIGFYIFFYELLWSNLPREVFHRSVSWGLSVMYYGRIAYALFALQAGAIAFARIRYDRVPFWRVAIHQIAIVCFFITVTMWLIGWNLRWNMAVIYSAFMLSQLLGSVIGRYLRRHVE